MMLEAKPDNISPYDLINIAYAINGDMYTKGFRNIVFDKIFDRVLQCFNIFVSFHEVIFNERFIPSCSIFMSNYRY